MRDSESNQIQVIKKLELAFGRHRRRNDGKRYPAKLRTMAIAALDSGVAGRAVAAAAGVTPKSLRNWRAGVGVIPPKELKIVSACEPTNPATSVIAGLARVTLSSGTTIEIPTSALTTTLINALNGGAV